MKARLSLPERPSALYLLAVLDVLAVLLIFFALIPAVAEQAGVPLNKMMFSSRMDTIPPGKRATLFGRDGPQPRFHLGRREVAFENLEEELLTLKEERGLEVLVAIMDENMAIGLISDLERLAAEVGIEVILGGRMEMEKNDFRSLGEKAIGAESLEQQEGARD